MDDETDYSVVYGTLANFDIEKKIGKGQFSEVYRARCKQDGRIVALKKVQVRTSCSCSANCDLNMSITFHLLYQKFNSFWIFLISGNHDE